MKYLLNVIMCIIFLEYKFYEGRIFMRFVVGLLMFKIVFVGI